MLILFKFLTPILSKNFFLIFPNPIKVKRNPFHQPLLLPFNLLTFPSSLTPVAKLPQVLVFLNFN